MKPCYKPVGMFPTDHPMFHQLFPKRDNMLHFRLPAAHLATVAARTGTFVAAIAALSTAAQAAGTAASAAKGAGASPAPSIQPIDPDRAAKSFKRGKFLSESTETGADGKTSRETEAMCMDEGNASFLPMAALMGVAGCDPQATREDKLSFSVQASCPRDTKFGPNAYDATLRWSADGKQITLQSTRRALVDGKASDKVVQSLRYQLTWQAARCD
ncbi:hypothetical protein CQB05_05450 [Paracidovorax citrulli]|uniref:Uncharacterized protein n=2 Tax=Paracidovorax citrulli TaxID=80869 RepID=A1TSU1_PARC0|nr:hypothetical protein Aave_3472 [Paracidovorax citrulli AAC00-1]ATG93552.1 hypothetical protein CQB05_05450 [Paracidovorax citrulli]